MDIGVAVEAAVCCLAKHGTVNHAQQEHARQVLQWLVDRVMDNRIDVRREGEIDGYQRGYGEGNASAWQEAARRFTDLILIIPLGLAMVAVACQVACFVYDRVAERRRRGRDSEAIERWARGLHLASWNAIESVSKERR